MESLTLKELRESRGKSLKETAKAIGKSKRKYKSLGEDINRLEVVEFAELMKFFEVTDEEKQLLIKGIK